MKQAKTFRPDEIKRVLAYVGTRRHAVRDRAIVVTSFQSGMRAHEMASLRIGDVIDEDGQVRNEVILKPEQTKGRFTRRVFINAKLKKELAVYLKKTYAELPTTEPLFRSQKRRAFNGNTMCQLFLNIYKAAGIKGASSHSGRRTFITSLAGKSISVRVLAALAGHSSIATTQRYIDVNDDQLRNAVELVS